MTPRPLSLVDVDRQIATDLASAYIKLRMARFRLGQKDSPQNRHDVAAAYAAVDAILDMRNEIADSDEKAST